MRAAGRIKDGDYSLIVEASDALVGAVSVAVPFSVDATAPHVRFLPARGIRLEVSEPGRLWLRIDGARVERVVLKAGAVRVSWDGAARRVRVVAEDAAGNRSKPVLRIAKTPK
jgi:hypothetical protein